MTVVAHSGRSPTIERTLSREPVPSGARRRVVVEPVLFVPETVRPDAVGRDRDPEDVLDELGREVLVAGVVGRDLGGHLGHVLGVEGHPGGGVRLLEAPSGGQGRAAVEHTDVVQAEEAAFEDVLAELVLPVHPPGEVQDQLVERALQEVDVAPPVEALLV
jgi:hypothetical protein